MCVETEILSILLNSMALLPSIMTCFVNSVLQILFSVLALTWKAIMFILDKTNVDLLKF